MNQNEILNANLLDIIFDNRNKNYGAYALRKFYPGRLTKSLSISIGLVLFLFLLTLFIKQNKPNEIGSAITDVDLISVKVPEVKPPEQPKPIVQPGASTVADVNRIIFSNETTVPTEDDINKKLIGTENIDVQNNNTQPTQEVHQIAEPGTTAATTEPPPGITKEAEFPGGVTAFANFLRIKLSTPEDLEPGQKQKVLVRFKVDVDGVISNIEVIETGGIRFDNEVIRVLKKMPKWSPAMQNGIKVSSYFIQVVTFVGEEQ